MAKIDILIERVAQRLADAGISERAASLEATGSPDALRYIRTRRAMPSASRLAAIANTLDTTPQWLIGDVEDERDWKRPSQTTSGDIPGMIRAIKRSRDVEPAFSIPVYQATRSQEGQLPSSEAGSHRGSTIEAQQIRVDFRNTVTRWSDAPIDPAEQEMCYGIFLPSNALHPAIPPGTPALVSTIRPVRELDLALFYLKPPQVENVHAEGGVAVPAYVRRINARSYDLEQFSGAQFQLPISDIAVVHRFFMMQDLLA